MLSWPDGGRRLIGTDGLVVDVEPGLYGVDARTMAAVDAAVPSSVVVPLPPRERTPAPEPAPEASGAPRVGSSEPAATTRRTGLQTAALVVSVLSCAVFGFLALAVSVFGGDEPDTGVGKWVAIAGFM
ncbi:hypothetical protein ACIF9R_27190 [Streptomyces sp. NPDC086080]|uniref:hypothetical protein n=1 Tax=Streptomyces sp. NPDC086080 TaxID=3365748 RepID=UPI0037D194A6